MKIRIFLVLGLAFLGFRANAQTNELHIGDSLPEVEIKSIINFKKEGISTSDFKEQLLIIDFWATSCSGCITSLARMDSLQKKYGDKIKILPVTYEPKKQVLTFWKSNKYTKNISLPSVVDDTIFDSLFRHTIIPHEVWIYKGRVRAITSDEYVDENNIDKILNNETVNWPVKFDYYSYDVNLPLFKFEHYKMATDNSFLKYAAIGGYKDSVNSQGFSGGEGIIRNKVNRTLRYYIINQAILNTYRLIFGKFVNANQLIKPNSIFSPNEVIWNVKDRYKYFYDKKNGYSQDWIRKNGISFESYSLDTNQTNEEVYKSVISELNALLGLQVGWELRRETVYTVTKTNLNRQPIIASKSTNSKIYTLSWIIYAMNLQSNNPYVFNEVKNSDVNLQLEIKSWTNFDAIKLELKKNGYDLNKDSRYVHKLIFSESNRIDEKAAVKSR